MLLLYIEAIVFCCFEYFAVSFDSVDSGLIFVGLIIVTCYWYIVALPTTIIPKISAIRLILLTVVTMFASCILSSKTKITFLIEIVLLAVSMLISTGFKGRTYARIAKTDVNSYLLYEFRVYKLHEINILNLIFFLCLIGAIGIIGLTVVTAFYTVLFIAILLPTNYRRMFGANMPFGNRKRYFAESLGIIVSLLYILLVSYLNWRQILNLVAIAPLLIYVYTTYKLWKEYRYYLYK